ncbi:MAG: O-antigen polymerase [Candidatus Acidiferrales bacterium]
MSFDKCLALLFSIMILVQAYWMRRRVGTWLFPACLFGLFWFAYSFVPLAVLFWMPAEPYAIGFLFLCTLVFSIGSMPFDWKRAFAINAEKRGEAAAMYGSSFLKAVFYMATLASLVLVILSSLAQGFSVHDFFFDLYATATAFALMRYSENLNANIYGPLSIVCVYLGGILGGLVYSTVPTKTERRLILFLSFLPSILLAVAQSSKGSLFLSIVFFYGGILVYRVAANTLRLFEKASIKSLVLYAALLISITTVSMVARGLAAIEDTSEVATRILNYYSLYAFGHIYAFSDWFAFLIGRHSELSYNQEGASYGFYTFAPLFRLMGSHKELPLGTYDDFYSSGDSIPTNIFTMFRGLIQDFGLAGTILFMLASSILLHWAFRTMLRNRRPAFTVAVFVFMMGYFYQSALISMLIWNSVYITFALVWIVLERNRLILQRDGGWFASPAQPAQGRARLESQSSRH